MNASPKNSGGTPDKGRGRRWVWPVLIVSLALNLLFVGLMAGSWWRHGGPHGSSNEIFVGAVEQLKQDLPQAKQERATQLVKEYREAIKSFRGESKAARDTAKDAVLIEPYDEEAVTKALSRFREIRNGQHEARHAMILGLLKELNFEERQQLLDNIRAGFRSRGRSGKPHQRRPDENAKPQ